MNQGFLPVTREEMLARGWEQPDFVYVTGDAYVDHPSFGLSIISRVLEAAGFTVAMLNQPGWSDASDYKRFGRPKLGFLVSSGVVDSMVNHYTAAKKRRHDDAYSPGGAAGHRPDRCTIVYCNRIREAYRDIPILIGGVEASLRRFAHYDYWDDRVRNSILVDSGADLLMYGMGEKTIVQCARWLKEGKPIAESQFPGTCTMRTDPIDGYRIIDPAETVIKDKKAYARAFMAQYEEQDPIRGAGLAQKHGKRYLCQHRPAMPLSRDELDRVYALPYARRSHPMYDSAGGVPALEEVKFSITSARGCFGACSFCALTFHQGRIVTSRGKASMLAEAKLLTRDPDFKGYIHDVGGPTANFRRPACKDQLKRGTCKHRQCLFPKPCKQLDADHSDYLEVLRDLRALPGVKKVFIRSGIRYDYLMCDKSGAFLKELVRHHISGQLKIAPEHVHSEVLRTMGKPGPEVYEAFTNRYEQLNRSEGLKQYIVPYFMSSHPGCTLSGAVELALYMKKHRLRLDQVQDFYPTPGTLSTAMFHTGLDPRTMKPVYVAKSPDEKAMQRALMQVTAPKNRSLVLKALKQAGREDLIGFSKDCLIAPREIARKPNRPEQKGKPKRNPRDDRKKSGGRRK